MKTRQECFAVRASVAAVRVALLAMALAPAAYAADPSAPDPAVAALTNPTNTIEVGAGYVSQDSFKFGQYNGLFNKGVYGIFNIDARGGAPYDSDSAQRWRIYGTNLGLDDRYLYGEFGDQGTYKVWGSYDQLRSNYATGDTYQTPFQGAGIQPADAAARTGSSRSCRRSNATGGNFRALSPTTGLANTAGERRLDAADAGAAGDRQQHHRQRRSGLPERRPRHDAQDLRGRLQRTTSARAGCSPRARARRSRMA